jgi:hypothetical protein
MDKKNISILEDKKIKAHSVLIEMNIEDYLNISSKILGNNPLQRKKIRNSSTVYSLLKEDLKSGCIIPPLVFAISDAEYKSYINDDEAIYKFIIKNFEKSIILDGLQRTYNIIEANDDLLKEVNKSNQDENSKNNNIAVLNAFHSHKLRFEFYLGIDKVGILYRMLTLNTGQTPMSLRHQIEILYSDYLSNSVNGIILLREVDEKVPSKLGEYKFQDIIEGFTSYLMKDYLIFDRSDILDNIKSLEKLSHENQGQDIFEKIVTLYHAYLTKIDSLSENWIFDPETLDIQLSGTPFGKTPLGVFNKSQVITGLGAAVSHLKSNKTIVGFDDVINDVERIYFSKSINYTYNNILTKLDDLRKNATKIGNAQRAYFHYFFRELFNKTGDSYLDISESIDNAFQKYRQNN